MLNLVMTRDGLAVSANNDGIDHINNHKHERGSCQIWAELLEDRTCNGGAAFASADEIGALSQAPCILEGVEYSDDGDMTPIGRIWYFSDYMTRDELQELADGKTVLFTELPKPSVFVDGFDTNAKRACIIWARDEYDPYDRWGFAMSWLFDVCGEMMERGIGLDVIADVQYQPGAGGVCIDEARAPGLAEMGDDALIYAARVLSRVETMARNAGESY